MVQDVWCDGVLPRCKLQTSHLFMWAITYRYSSMSFVKFSHAEWRERFVLKTEALEAFREKRPTLNSRLSELRIRSLAVLRHKRASISRFSFVRITHTHTRAYIPTHGCCRLQTVRAFKQRNMFRPFPAIAAPARHASFYYKTYILITGL